MSTRPTAQQQQHPVADLGGASSAAAAVLLQARAERNKKLAGGQSGIVSFILAAYNTALAALWAYLLVVVVGLSALPLVQKKYVNLPFPLPFGNLYRHAGPVLELAQLLAFVEIGFIIIGWVPSKVGTALLQTATRCLVIFAGMATSLTRGNAVADTQITNVAGLAVLSVWCLSEVIRYPFLAFKASMGAAPKFVEWLRYTAFIILYPIGMVGEMTILTYALPSLEASPRYAVAGVNWLPWFVKVALLCFPPGFWMLYSHMLAQRKKVLAAAPAPAPAAAAETKKTQ